MAEGLLVRVASDLRQALAEGARRDPAVSPDGSRWLAASALVCALAGLTLVIFGGYHAGFLGLNAAAAQAPDWVWQWLTVLGDERSAFALSLFFARRHPRVLWALVLAALVGIAITHGLKPLFAALRPPAVLPGDAFHLIGPGHRKGSFPSGHSLTIAVLVGVWVYYLRSAPLRVLLILAAILVGLSRVAVGVHWPVDVAAGLTGGVLAAWLGTRLARGSDWGVSDPSVHLALVVLAAMLASSLLYWDGGYGAAAQMQQVLGIAALGFAAWGYLVMPLIRLARPAG
jgi:membrane-associated phospholipid phosphatase